MPIPRDKVLNASKARKEASSASKPAPKATRAKSSKTIDEAIANHPAGKGRAKFDFTGKFFDTRILNKIGKEGIKQVSDTTVKGTRSIGDYDVTGKGPQKVYLTQTFEKVSDNAMTVFLRVGPRPDDDNLWEDKYQFKLAGGRVSIARKAPNGKTATSSYSAIKSNKVEGDINFAGIAPERLYTKVEQGARLVAKNFFNSEELVESLTRFSTGDTLTASTFADHKVSFADNNFYTRPLYAFGKRKNKDGVLQYPVNKNGSATTSAKTWSIGEFAIVDGNSERWYMVTRFKQEGDTLQGQLKVTNAPNAEIASSVDTVTNIVLTIVRKGESYAVTSTMKIGDKEIYRDKAQGTADEIYELTGKSRKLAWKPFDKPFKRTFGLLIESLDSIEAHFAGGDVEVAKPEAEVEAPVAKGLQGTARKSNRPVIDIYNDKMDEAFEFFKDNSEKASKVFDFVLNGESYPCTLMVNSNGSRSIYFNKEDNGFLEGASFRATYGKRLTASITYNNLEVSKSKAIPQNLASIEQVQSEVFDSLDAELKAKGQGIFDDNTYSRSVAAIVLAISVITVVGTTLNNS